MRNALLPALLLLTGAAAVAADRSAKAPAPPPDSIPFDDPQVVELMKKIDAAGAYATPAMNLKKDANYAGTAEDREPFAGTKPFQENFLLQIEYAGAGRGKPEPAQLDRVKVGFIGPIEATVSIATGGQSHEEALGIPMLQGARLAVEEGNARGGYLERKIPFELVVSNDNGLWGSSGNEIVKQAYRDEVWGILGTIDGANSHIAIRVALKAEVLMINSGDTDPTFIETNIPWVARVIGDDRQQAYLLTDYWYRKLGLEKVAIVRASNRYGRFGVREIRDSARRLKRPVPIEMAYKVGQQDFRLEVERIRNTNPDAVVHWGDAVEGARVLNTMRAMGMRQPFFGCDRTVSPEFVKLAGGNAEGVIAAFPWNPERKDPKLERFRQAYRARFGMEAETYAAHAYDGMNLLLWAINVAGLNRAKVRDLVAFLPHPWPGVTGDIVFSACLDDVADTYLARYRNGAWSYLSRGELAIPRGKIPPRDRLNRDAETPYKAQPREPLDFRGPGREEPEPDVGEVVLGWFGPDDPDHPEFGELWRGARLALELENSAGGYRGRPFRLVPSWSESPWSAGVVDVTRSVFERGAWAVIGGVDGATTHLAVQVALKSHLLLLSPGSTDVTTDHANVPWLFSLPPSDEELAPVLAAGLGRAATGGSFVVAAAADHDSHAALVAVRREMASLKLTPVLELAFSPGEPDLATLAARLLAPAPRAVLVLAPSRATGRLVAAIRARGFEGALLGGATAGRAAFRRAGGQAVEGVQAPIVIEPGSGWNAFAEAYEVRWREPPEAAAAQGYDAVRLVVDAVRRAGLNRARLRDAVRELSPWAGASGPVRWNPLGRNLRAATLGVWRDGRLEP